MLNTKFDYEYIRENSKNWQAVWQQLLDSRFVVDDSELVEDQNAQIFRLGFTAAEVAEAIGHTGYTQRELDWYQSQPDRYNLTDGVYVEVEGWRESKDAELLAEVIAEKCRELQAEKVCRRDAGIVIDGILWDSDQSAQTMYTQFALSLSAAPDMVIPDWKASFGVFTEMNAVTFAKIRDAWTTHCSSITTTQKNKEIEIKSLATVEEVEAYDVTTGWDI